MFQPLTQAYLTGAVRDIITHFNRSQAEQTARFDARLDEVDAKLDAIMEMLAMRKELRALVRELKAQGISLDESRIFAA